jgi:site-specific recombinase XerD
MFFESVFEELDGAYAENTLRAYRSDLNRFIEWLLAHDQHPADACHLDLIGYLENGCHDLTSASIQRTVAAIGTIYHYGELNNPTKHPKVKLTLRKLSRAKGNLQKQAKPLTRELLEKLLEHCDLSTPKGMRDAVLLNLGYETMRRRSELVSFRFNDLRVSASGDHGILLRYSKTDQHGHGRVIPVSAELADLINSWKSYTGDGFILRGVKRDGEITDSLAPESVNRILKQLESRLGYKQPALSGHSFRVGKTVDMIECGFSVEQIAIAGGWTSAKTVFRYAQSWTKRDLATEQFTNAVP